MTPKKKLSEIVKNMSALKQQWSQTAPAPDTDTPVPAGVYVCDLLDGAAFESRGGTPGYKVTLKVREGEFTGRLVWHDFYLSEKALPYTLRALTKIGITRPEQLDEPLPAGLVVRAKVVINKRDDGAERNEVRSWELVAVVAPEPGLTPPPEAPNPWDVSLDGPDVPGEDGR